MHLQSIVVKNFRLLRDITLALEQGPTVIVGRNNSGKTSLTELFRRLLGDTQPSFRFEDFSLATHDGFWTAHELHRQGRPEEEIRGALPEIVVRLTVRYDNAALGPLTPFVIDLDPNCSDALIIVRYAARAGATAALFEGVDIGNGNDAEKRAVLCRSLRECIPKHYSATVTAQDPNDATNVKPIEWPLLRGLLQGGFINAQRGLDDVTHKDTDVLGKVLEALFRTASSATSDADDRLLAKELEIAVTKVQESIRDGFSKQLTKLLPTFSLFGYPGLADPRLGTETVLNVKQLLADHTHVYYTGINGINLPESYNGLGTRNLIYILLRLHQFFKAFMAEEHSPGMQLVFIEEPECHLHPQMQAVFIHKLAAIAKAFCETLDPQRAWPVQFIVTTHSSHVANKASFDAIRYFLTASDAPGSLSRYTRVKDLREGLAGTSQPDRDFLHKYMTVTRCDLLFADKAILIEGETERLLMPQMIDALDLNAPPGTDLLSSQYVSVIEVGGAHAHIFSDLLAFLELRTLIVSDLDSTKRNANGRGVACMVSEADATSNACIKKWFDGESVTPTTLLGKREADKTRGDKRIAFQIPEGAGQPCGRSFEGAFILANLTRFALNSTPTDQLEHAVWLKTEAIDKKSDFAIEHGIRATGWQVPKYIQEGLKWLAASAVEPAQALLPAAANEGSASAALARTAANA